MSHVTQGDVQALVAEIAELKQQLGSRKDQVSPFTNTSSIRIDAGAAGVWIAMTCCGVMLTALFVAGGLGSEWLAREFSRVDKELNERKEEGQRMQSYISAIYVQAPGLKPEDYEESKESKDAN